MECAEKYYVLVARVLAVGIVVEAGLSVHDGITPGATDRERVTHYRPLRFSVECHYLPHGQLVIQLCRDSVSAGDREGGPPLAEFRLVVENSASTNAPPPERIHGHFV